MSRQQTFAPDDLETHRQKRSMKKAKPWVLWYRMAIGSNRFLKSWSRFGRYASYLIAQEARDSDARKWPRPFSFEYRIMHEDEGKPE